MISLTRSVKTNESHKHFIFLGDFNNDIGISNGNHEKLEEFCSLFNLKSLIEKEVCIAKTNNSTIDLISTNKPRSFQSSSANETDSSDHHKLMAMFVKSHFTRHDPNTVYYRNFKKFDGNFFLNDLK